MTDDEILSAARRAYREMGVRPVQHRWYMVDPARACLLTAAGCGREGSKPEREVVNCYGIAAFVMGRSHYWVYGVCASWDGFNMDTIFGRHDDYQAGYAFGLRCRGEFADLLGELPS